MQVNARIVLTNASNQSMTALTEVLGEDRISVFSNMKLFCTWQDRLLPGTIFKVQLLVGRRAFELDSEVIAATSGQHVGCLELAVAKDLMREILGAARGHRERTALLLA